VAGASIDAYAAEIISEVILLTLDPGVAGPDGPRVSRPAHQSPPGGAYV